MVQHSGAILNLSGQTVFEQGLYDTYFYNSYDDFLNGISGGTGYLNLIATSGSSTDAVSGYSEHISYQPGKLVLKPARGVIFSGNTDIVSGYTSPIDVTGYIATSIDSDGTVVWSSLSAITSGTCIPSFSVQTITPCSSGGTVTVDGNFTVEGNFTVIGTTTSATTIIETETVRVEDNNIELNYGGNHTTAIGGGITVLSGVSNSQNSRIYTLSDGTFMFEPGLSATTGIYWEQGGTGNSALKDDKGGHTLNGSVTNGIIAGGFGNTLDDSTYSFMGGGLGNTIEGSSDRGSIVGGYNNTMTNGTDLSSIISGEENTIDSSDGAGIFAGSGNTIDGGSDRSTILAGTGNVINSTSNNSGIFVGSYNTIDDSDRVVILGGYQNTISGHTDASIIAGTGNTINDGQGEIIIGGTDNTIANAPRSIIIGGENITLNGVSNAVSIGGRFNNADSGGIGRASYEFLGGGEYNSIDGSKSSSIIAGTGNTVNVDHYGGIFGGRDNTINSGGGDSFDNTIIGGQGNFVGTNLIFNTSSGNTTVGGTSNVVLNSHFSSIIGGRDNKISSNQPISSSIIGGDSNQISGASRSVIIGGSGITATVDDTVYVPNLNIGTLGVGTSVNNLGVDTSGNVVVGSAGGTISGSGTTNQVTYWDSTSSITSDTGFTWDGSTMKITKNSTVGGIIVDTSGDPTPASFSDKYQAGFFLTESSNNDYDPTDLSSPLNTLSIGTVGLGFQTQGKIGPGLAFTFADDASTGGATAAIRMVKSDTDIFGESEDGALLVLGTREADNGGGGAAVKESIRIGHNQYVGINYTPDNSTNPTAMLTLGTNTGDDVTLALREISGTPAQITNYGQFYVKSSDSKPYFKDSSGTEYDISTGTGGGVTIDAYNDLGNVNTTQTWDVSGTSTNYELTLTGSITLNLNNVRNGDYGTIIAEQDGVGSHTLTFGTVNGGAGTHKVVNGGGGSPTLTSTPNAIDLLSFTYNGTTMYWSVGNDYT
jgi:hypothetical protein